MAEEAYAAGSGTGEETTAHDLRSLLAGGDRDYLARNNGDQVKISDLVGKIVGLYSSASWCGPCQLFTPILIDTYNELYLSGSNFEIVFISADEDEESFIEYFSKMPWLAIPFSDSNARENIDELFDISGIPHLVILDGNGKVLTTEGVQVIGEYGSEGYPFTPERIQWMKQQEEAAKKNQTLRSLLVSSTRDFVISKDGNKVLVTDLEGKIVGIYFSVSSYGSCCEFIKLLLEMYLKLKEKGESFEIILVSLDNEESSFKQALADMPWLALPFKERTCDKLVRYFELETIPTLVIIGSNGKTLSLNAVELVEEYGVDAYPFSANKLEEIAEKEKAKLESQTLESLLVSGERDYVIKKGDVKVPVSELFGKTILLYFSAQWCPPCRAFLPKLIEAYHKIKEKDCAFDIVFVSSDQDEDSFNDFFQEMPWLALPFGDVRKKSLDRTFKIQGIPSLVAISPTGMTITKDARELVKIHGAAAYPFTQERLQELEKEMEDMARAWPEKVKHELHDEHELVKTRRRSYVCDKCEDEGNGWSFYCDECDFDLHPQCALEDDKVIKVENAVVDGIEEKQGNGGKEGYICSGEVCHKV